MMVDSGTKDGYYMNLESARQTYWRSMLVEQRAEAAGHASDYINM
jgi:hypothetical protein